LTKYTYLHNINNNISNAVYFLQKSGSFDNKAERTHFVWHFPLMLPEDYPKEAIVIDFLADDLIIKKHYYR